MMASSSLDDIRRDITLERRITRDEIETMWVHLLRIPSLLRKSMDVIKSEYWYEAGYPELAVLWTAASQILASSDSATIKLLPLRTKFLSIVKDSDIDIDDRTVRDLTDDPRNEGQEVGLLYHAFRNVSDKDIDFDYGSGLVKLFAKEYAVVNPLKRMMNDDQFRESIPGNLTKVMERLSLSAEIVESLDSSQDDGVLFPEGWRAKPLIGNPTHLPFLDSFLSGGQIAGEVFGLLGPFGGGKTTLAIHLAVASARAFLADALRTGTKPLQAYYFGYEDGMDAYRVRMLSNAAHILRDRLEHGAELTRRGGLLEEYELEYWEQLRINPDEPLDPLQLDGEEERIVAAQKILNQSCRVFDMGDHGRGKGGVTEIAGILERECQKNGTQPGIVIIDYAGIVARRYVHASRTNATQHDVYAEITALPDKFKQVARRFGCPVWLLHQYTGLANKKSPTASMHHTDAGGATGFGENCDFCICVGQKDPNTRVARVQCTKARRGGTDGAETLMKLEGEFAQVIDARTSYRLDPETNQILPSAQYEQMHGGEELTVAEPSQRTTQAGRSRRGRSTDRIEGQLPWQ